VLRLGLPKGRLLQRGRGAVETLAPQIAIAPWFLRMPDIPALVAEDALDAGIVGEEWLVETAAPVRRIAPLGWYRVRICALGLPGLARLRRPVRVVSEYGAITHGYATSRWGSDFRQRTVRGSVEQFVPDIADVAVECVETGHSMRSRGLVVLDTLFDADVWLVTSPALTDAGCLDVLRRWAGRIAEGVQPHDDRTAA
jgi:ATP phosphoribosyltransferase